MLQREVDRWLMNERGAARDHTPAALDDAPASASAVAVAEAAPSPPPPRASRSTSCKNSIEPRKSRTDNDLRCPPTWSEQYDSGRGQLGEEERGPAGLSTFGAGVPTTGCCFLWWWDADNTATSSPAERFSPFPGSISRAAWAWIGRPHPAEQSSRRTSCRSPCGERMISTS